MGPLNVWGAQGNSPTPQAWWVGLNVAYFDLPTQHAVNCKSKLGVLSVSVLPSVWYGVVCVFSSLQVRFRVDICLLSGQNVTCTRAFFLLSDWYYQSKTAEVNNFSHGCYQVLSFPRFSGESLGMRLPRNLLTVECCEWSKTGWWNGLGMRFDHTVHIYSLLP